MLRVLRAPLRHYRELILAGTFAALAAWEILEMLLLERVPETSLSLALVVHSLQVALILAATALALRAWREKTACERALGTLVEQVIVAQEEERRRVAYDVHDGVAQLVVSAKQHIDTAADLWAVDPERAAGETAIAADRLAQAIGETRRILAALRPLAVDAAGLAGAARRSLDDVARDTGWSVSLVENLGGSRLPPTVEATAFRILREALSNARKHAGPTRIEVVLAREADRFHLDVRDHGVGPDRRRPSDGPRGAAEHARARWRRGGRRSRHGRRRAQTSLDVRARRRAARPRAARSRWARRAPAAQGPRTGDGRRGDHDARRSHAGPESRRSGSLRLRPQRRRSPGAPGGARSGAPRRIRDRPRTPSRHAVRSAAGTPRRTHQAADVGRAGDAAPRRPGVDQPGDRQAPALERGHREEYLQRALETLGASDRTQAAVEAVKRGLLP